ncbi:capsular polysaccharide biosynthesis protein [Loktanella sp. SALINAS62]|uniref:capsular polysaccharide biosynthesis protein n=1 Tax=Loktanella sp. SALINAS62 TaxID=2706124 RepID=UPI001B8D9D9F|nr:capsular polysaccharide biosynthesis protein [Loktanella sp. SALINAS62]MBS1303035.1 capsular polysaccharide biosynthesis protein [Loktanella sp. SALINAS62]
MTLAPQGRAAAGESLRRLFVYNGGFLTQTRVRRILTLAGWDIRLGMPGDGDHVGVWGHSPTAPRGEAVAARKATPIVRVEDAFLRSIQPGRDGEAPIGLTVDLRGIHYDPGQPSDLEVLLRDTPLDNTVLLQRARDCIDRIARARLSKYNIHDPDLPVPDPGYVLVIDQTKGDAAVTASGADSNTFREMLFYAQTEHPAARIVIKTHPETVQGHRAGYFTADDATDRITLLDDPACPHALLEGAVAVYTVSSHLGFEAIMAGHRPIVFGQPFYMGWGLTDDRKPLDRRQRKLTRAQLFTGAMILYPLWFDPYHDRLCALEDVIDGLAARVRAWREDHDGWRAHAMSTWKRAPLQRVFGSVKPVTFSGPTGERRDMIWASKATADSTAVRVEDGFLRSRGLGADLIPPLSLVLDDLGIYYDPSRHSRLETLIAASPDLPDHARARADRLIATLTRARLTKYNLSGAQPPALPDGRRVLVPGQVADDASVRLGATEVATNADLLRAARDANPAAVILYKPHPDVVAGLRGGAVPDALTWADAVLDVDAATALDLVDEVWTMTSGLGFEALLRGKRITCLGQPFYAGWGLTDDRAMPILRRSAMPSLTELVHATLIDYPRYFDPVTGLACPVEVVVARLRDGHLPHPGWRNRLLAKLQGHFASKSWLWRGRG